MCSVGRNGSRFSVVPWYNRHEWEKVYQNLFSSSWEDQCAGLASVAMWKSRLYGRLPPAIEATAALVRAQLNDTVTPNGAFAVHGMNADELSSLFALGIVRFVGDIVEPLRSEKNISAMEAAFQLGVPDWVLDLRHASVHGSTCGGSASLGLLRTAASLLLEWLRSNHWEVQRDSLVATEAPSLSTGATLQRETPAGGDGEGQPGCCTPAQVRHVLDNWLSASAKKQRRGVPAREMAARQERKKVCVKQLAALVDEDSDLVVETLVMGGDYLLPSREALEELCPNLKLNLPLPLDGVPCQLPRLLVACWDPLLATLNPHVLQMLAERLMTQPWNRRSPEDERLRRCLSVAWVSHLLARGRPGLQPGPQGGECSGGSSHKRLNVTRLLMAALDNPMEYSPKVVTLIARYMWPPLAEHNIGLINALTTIHLGLMVIDHNSGNGSDPEQQEPEEQPRRRGRYIPFTVEDFQGGENDSKEPAWALPRTPMDWSSTPIGALPGFPADKVDLTLNFKELGPVGAPRPQQAGPGTGQEAVDAPEGDLGAEDLEQLPPPDQMDYISQNVHMFVM